MGCSRNRGRGGEGGERGGRGYIWTLSWMIVAKLVEESVNNLQPPCFSCIWRHFFASVTTTFVIQFLPVFDRTIRKMEWGELAASGAVSLKLDVMCLKLSSCSVQMVFARTWNVWNSQDWCIYRDRFSTSRTEKILMELFREYEIYTSTLHHCFFFSF